MFGGWAALSGPGLGTAAPLVGRAGWLLMETGGPAGISPASRVGRRRRISRQLTSDTAPWSRVPRRPAVAALMV